MRIGTKSVLFGAHCFLLHWFFVARGWHKLYGFRSIYIGQRASWPRQREFASLWRPALWFAFFLHDIGYLGKPNMDGPEGEEHPRVGGKIMRTLFGEPWGTFTANHSRFFAKLAGQKPSPLCFADKCVPMVTPEWLYLWPIRWTGEIYEYMAGAKLTNNTGTKYEGMNRDHWHQRAWLNDMNMFMRSWIAEHMDGSDDTVTRSRHPLDGGREYLITENGEARSVALDATGRVLPTYNTTDARPRERKCVLR